MKSNSKKQNRTTKTTTTTTQCTHQAKQSRNLHWNFFNEGTCIGAPIQNLIQKHDLKSLEAPKHHQSAKEIPRFFFRDFGSSKIIIIVSTRVYGHRQLKDLINHHHQQRDLGI
jgi:hypothetical protein